MHDGINVLYELTRVRVVDFTLSVFLPFIYNDNALISRMAPLGDRVVMVFCKGLVTFWVGLSFV